MAQLPDGSTHSAHFNSDFQGNFSQFGTALVSQLVTVPLPSPASGFTYQLDPSTGVFERSTTSFGPNRSTKRPPRGVARKVSVVTAIVKVHWIAAMLQPCFS
jgi:hypothetical protein